MISFALRLAVLPFLLLALTVSVTGSSVRPLEAQGRDAREIGQPCTLSSEAQAIKWDRSLVITLTDVVDHASNTSDPADKRINAGGRWTFGKLLSDALGANAEAAARAWVDGWKDDFPVVDSDMVLHATILQRPWVTTALGDAWMNFDPSGSRTLPYAPFRLLAIVNRFDLRKPGSNAGSVRFVFGAITQTSPLNFTVVLEFAVQAASDSDLQNWAKAWVDLGTAVNFTGELEKLTDKVAATTGPISGQLIAIRTNELVPGGSGWDFREFAPSAGAIVRRALAQTSRPNQVGGLDDAVVSSWMTYAYNLQTMGSRPDVPRDYTVTGIRQHFQEVAAPGFGLTGYWAAPNADAPAQSSFAFLTCNGCHGPETKTLDLLFHIKPRNVRTPSNLSEFLCTPGSPDCTLPWTTIDPRTGDDRDLTEMSCRKNELANGVRVRPLGAPAGIRAFRAH